MFRHRQQLRRWAARVLLLWLYGLGTGLANACLATSLVLPTTPVGAYAAAGVTPGTDSAQAHLREPCHHGQQGAPTKSNCADFCDKAGISVPPLKSALGDVQGHALPLAAIAIILPVPVFEPVRLWLPRREGVAAPPIPLAFLRLTL